MPLYRPFNSSCAVASGAVCCCCCFWRCDTSDLKWFRSDPRKECVDACWGVDADVVCVCGSACYVQLERSITHLLLVCVWSLAVAFQVQEVVGAICPHGDRQLQDG